MKTVDSILRQRLNGMKQRCGNPNDTNYKNKCGIARLSSTVNRPTVTLSNEQAASIAAVILPMIRGYVDSHKAEYEPFLKEWSAKKKLTEGGQQCV